MFGDNYESSNMSGWSCFWVLCFMATGAFALYGGIFAPIVIAFVVWLFAASIRGRKNVKYTKIYRDINKPGED